LAGAAAGGASGRAWRAPDPGPASALTRAHCARRRGTRNDSSRTVDPPAVPPRGHLPLNSPPAPARSSAW
jgi:hypothetical protein